jgi:C4-dicarboxylate-specific signal transduction histidine kinase
MLKIGYRNQQPFKPQLTLKAGREVKVRASKAWIKILLELLLDNATEVLKNHEHKIGMPRIKITTLIEGNQVKVTISDNGPGFDKDIRNQIFRNQIHKSSSAPTRGFGLLIARAIIETYAGSIEVENVDENVEVGAKVSFRLPCAS